MARVRSVRRPNRLLGLGPLGTGQGRGGEPRLIGKQPIDSRRNECLNFCCQIAPLVRPVAATQIAGQELVFRTEGPGVDQKAGTVRPRYQLGRIVQLPVLADRDDQRVLRGCGWLRSTRLDELPQFWNVVRGEMSLVGPRPERPELVAQFEAAIPGYGRRHEIPPGITGLAQTRSGYHTDPAYKLGHDLQYLMSWSPILDAQILARTVLVMVRRQS